jgi:hypothetical protein
MKQRMGRCFRAAGQDGTSEDRNWLIGGADQRASMRHRAERALVAGGAIGVDVVRLGKADEQHQQRAHHRKRSLTGAKSCRLLTIHQRKLTPLPITGNYMPNGAEGSCPWAMSARLGEIT